MTCPRCQSPDTEVHHTGYEDGRVVWKVLHCSICSFTWRDNEPPESIDPKARDPFFHVDPSRISDYPVVLPKNR